VEVVENCRVRPLMWGCDYMIRRHM